LGKISLNLHEDISEIARRDPVSANNRVLVRRMLSEIADHFRQGKRWEIIEIYDEGIPKTKLVLAFHSSRMGEQSDFAIA